jgi:hypothetical protein
MRATIDDLRWLMAAYVKVKFGFKQPVAVEAARACDNYSHSFACRH